MGRLRIPLLLLLVLAAFGHAGAQPGFGRYELPKEDPSAFKIITPADLDEAVRKLARLRTDLAGIKNEKERRAQLTAILNVCQQELDREVNATGTVAMNDGPTREDGRFETRRWMGAYNELERQIRGLGKEGLDLYEELNGKRAANLLNAALVAQDLQSILDVNKRFGLTQAGIRAALVLAQIEWEQGRFSPAARALERALEFRELHQPQTEANISAWLARIYRELGERANLAQLRLWVKPFKDLEVDVGGGLRKLDELLGDEYSRTRDSTNDTVEDQGICWPGGNFANTGISIAPSPHERVAWAQTLPRLESDWWQSRYMQYQYSNVPPYLPVSDGTLLYVNCGESLAAYDVLTGGKRAGVPMWRCKPYANDENFWRTAEPDPALTLPVSVYRGTVYAPLENPLRSPIHQRTADNRFGLYSHYPQVRRSLCAVDAETGRLLWKQGGQYEGGDLEQTSFGPAVVHEGTLYAVGTRVPGLADVVLYALDPQSGAVRWNMRLCYGQQEVTMFGRPARWPFTSLPAIAGGQLYLCTNLGGIVAVNLERRCLAWIAKYEYMVRPMTNSIYTYYRPTSWFNSPTICAEAGGERYVLSAPADSHYLVCLNARTGEEVWSLARAIRSGDDYIESGTPLAQARALIGVRNNTVIVGGGTRLYGIDLATGRILKAVNVMAELGAGRSTANELQGRPALAGNKLYWPGHAGITTIELDTWRMGATVSAPSLNSIQGLSVFCQQGILFTIAGNDYTAGNPQVAARFDAQLLLTDSRLRVANSPEDADAALRYGLLNLRMGDKAEARTWLEKAFSLASGATPQTRVLNLAGRVLLSLALEQADALIEGNKLVEALGQVEASRKYATMPTQFTEIFVRQELCLVKRGEVAALRILYTQTIEQDPAFGIGQDPEIPARYYASIMLARMDASLKGNEASALSLYESLLAAPDSLRFERVSLRQLGINGMSALLESAGRTIYARREADAAALLAAGDRDSLRTILRLYPHALAADDAALRLADQLLADGAAREAATMLQTALDERGTRPQRGPMLALLAIAQFRSGEALRARLTARRVLREFPEGEVTFEGKHRTFKEALAELISAKNAGAEAPPAARIGAPLIELWNEEWPPTSQLGFMYLPQQPAASQPPVILTLRSTGDSPLRALKPADGEVAWSGGNTQGLGALNNVRRLGENMLLQFSSGVALYSDAGREQWVCPTGDLTLKNVDAREGMVLFSLPGDGTRRSVCRIVALDAASGATAWNVPVEGMDVLWVRQCAIGALVLATSGREDRLLLLDLENGAELKRVKLDRAASRNVNCKPILTDSGVNIVDDRGDISCYATEDFSLKARVVSRQVRPTLFAAVKGGLLVLGYPGAALCDMAAQKNQWETSYKQEETVVDRALAGEVLVLALSERYESDRLVGISLRDGSQAFEHKIESANEGERVKLRARLELQDAAAFGYTVFDTSTGMSELQGFKLLVIGADGRVRLDWYTAANANSEIMQLAAIDGYIVLTADRTTHCFGVKE